MKYLTNKIIKYYKCYPKGRTCDGGYKGKIYRWTLSVFIVFRVKVGMCIIAYTRCIQMFVSLKTETSNEVLTLKSPEEYLYLFTTFKISKGLFGNGLLRLKRKKWFLTFSWRAVIEKY